MHALEELLESDIPSSQSFDIAYAQYKFVTLTQITLLAVLPLGIAIATYEAAGLSQKVHEYNLIAAIVHLGEASISALNGLKFMRESLSAVKRLWKSRIEPSSAAFENPQWFLLMVGVWKRCILYAKQHPAEVNLALDAIKYGIIFMLEEWSFDASEIQLKGLT